MLALVLFAASKMRVLRVRSCRERDKPQEIRLAGILNVIPVS